MKHNNVHFFSSFLICLLLHSSSVTNGDSCVVGSDNGDGGGPGGNGCAGDGGNGNGDNGNVGVSTSWVTWHTSNSLLLSCWSH